MFIVWLICHFSASIVINYTCNPVTVPPEFVPFLQSWLTLRTVDGKHVFQIESTQTNFWAWVYSDISAVHLSTILYFVSLTNLTTLDLFVLTFASLLFSIAFGIVGQIKKMGIWIAPGSWQRMSVRARIVLCVFMSYIGALLWCETVYAFQNGQFWLFVSKLVGIPAAYTWLYHFAKERFQNTTWHLHHWFIGFYLVLLGSNYEALVVGLGLFWQGCFAYTVAPVIF